MVSAFLVNDKPIGFRNPSTVKVDIEGITSSAQRSASGDMTTINKVNSVAKLNLSWEYLSVEDMEKLCTLFQIDVADFEQPYVAKDIAKLVYKITTRLPMGIKSFSAYVGDTFSATLCDNSGESDEKVIGGNYWKDISLSLVGTGEQWNA